MHRSDDVSALALFPRPQHVRQIGDRFRLPPGVALDSDRELGALPALDALSSVLEARGHQLGRHPGPDVLALHLRRAPAELARRLAAARAGASLPDHAGAQGYAASVAPHALTLCYGDDAGLHNALATLAQLLATAEGSPGAIELPALEIDDWPDFAQRGVMLDISRDKVPTLDTLRALVDRLASWKINQLQLYMEHTFAYRDHEQVWRDASPLTADEVRELDAYCARRHLELVPNQNSFGHMHRWLVHEPYRALAECPDGFDHPWNWTGEPYGLCATDPASLAFLERLYDELLPNFESRLFNVGLDETLDLGFGRSRATCEVRGTGRVYLDFLNQVHARVQQRGHRMQFWGDIIVKHPELIPELPRDAIALEWGYEADHPFAPNLEAFRRAGLEFYVCPGTSSWNSIAGRTDNARLNLARAARAGKAAGARGMLITDWGDHGHLQPLPVSYLGLLLGAGFAWNVADAEEPLALDVPRLLDTHVFFDQGAALGRVAHDLGNAYREAGSLRPNASVLFWLLIKPERLLSPPGVSEHTLQHTLAYVEAASAALQQSRAGSAAQGRAPEALAEGARVTRELAWARDMLRFACRLGSALCRAGGSADPSLVPRPERAALAEELQTLIERHRAGWLERNRPGGLDDSAGRLARTLDALRA